VLAWALLLVAACGGPEAPTTPDDLVGLWKLDRPVDERRTWGNDWMRFTEDGRFLWGATKGSVTTGLESYRYSVEGDDTIVLTPPPSPESARVIFSFNGRNWLVTRVGNRSLKYRRQQL